MNKGVIAAVVVIVIAVVAGLLIWPGPGPNPPSNTPNAASSGSKKSLPTAENNAKSKPSNNQAGAQAGGKASSQPGKTKSPEARQSKSGAPAPLKPKKNEAAAANQSPAEMYCNAEHDKRKTRALTQALTKAGGLIQIFQHESAVADAYGCASAYLANGGDIDALDPRADAGHLTPLLFAIKRNDPKMVHFVLDHGANPKKRGGKTSNNSKGMKPYGYAVFSALHNRSTDYNQVIGILNSALGKSGDSSASKQ